LKRYLQITRKLKRYNQPDFHSSFVLLVIEGDIRIVIEEMDSEDGKLSTKAMVQEMETLDKYEAWELVKFPNGRN